MLGVGNGPYTMPMKRVVFSHTQSNHNIHIAVLSPVHPCTALRNLSFWIGCTGAQLTGNKK